MLSPSGPCARYAPGKQTPARKGGCSAVFGDNGRQAVAVTADRCSSQYPQLRSGSVGTTRARLSSPPDRLDAIWPTSHSVTSPPHLADSHAPPVMRQVRPRRRCPQPSTPGSSASPRPPHASAPHVPAPGRADHPRRRTYQPAATSGGNDLDLAPGAVVSAVVCHRAAGLRRATTWKRCRAKVDATRGTDCGSALAWT